MVQGFGGVVTKLTEEQADYINVPQDGPFKEDSYKYQRITGLYPKSAYNKL